MRKSIVNIIGCGGRRGQSRVKHSGPKRGQPRATVGAYRKMKLMARRKKRAKERKTK